NEFFNTKYASAIKNNLRDKSYESLKTEFKVNNFITTFDYLNENNNSEKNSYLLNKTAFKFDDSKNRLKRVREYVGKLSVSDVMYNKSGIEISRYP
ncbi:MAG: hypothetical protein HOF29_12675, partial [Candidatus Marinimicrobia bacterium]|nr:hypothetical protein [Candidatus Neomarinimicrobiota bacterium]